MTTTTTTPPSTRTQFYRIVFIYYFDLSAYHIAGHEGKEGPWHILRPATENVCVAAF